MTSTGVTLGTAALGTTVIAAESVPVEIAEVIPVADVVILENTGDEAVDLGGYVMDWEYDDDPSQTDSFNEGVTIEAGEALSVWTGFQSTQIEDVQADVQLDEYGNGRINPSEADVVALVSPDGEVVDGTEATVDDGYSYEDYRDDDTDDDPSDGDGDRADVNGDVTIEVTTEITNEEYLENAERDDDGEPIIECNDCQGIHNTETLEIEDVSSTTISGEASLTQDCSSQEYEVFVFINDSLTGSVPVELHCIEKAIAEFEFELEEPLKPGEYEVTVSVGSKTAAIKEQESFQIEDEPQEWDDSEEPVEEDRPEDEAGGEAEDEARPEETPEPECEDDC